jgi:nucleotide-binding universal stress UspA family protein
MFKTILVPTDGSESSKKALKYAVNFAKIYGAVVKGISVVDIRTLEGPFVQDLVASTGLISYEDSQGKIKAILEQKAEAVLKELSEYCKENDVICDTKLTIGIVSKVICEEAGLADVVIMSSHGEHQGFTDVLLGSTTESVIRKSNKPVILINKDCLCSVENVLVAYDGGSYSKDALAVAANIAVEQKCKISVLVVDKSEAEHKNILADAKKYLESYHVKFEGILAQGEIAEEILAQAEKTNSQLIIMGAYGHSKLHDVILGSVTQYVLNEAECPVLVVK